MKLSIHFNDAPVGKDVQRHLGLFLEKILNFNCHIKQKLGKAIKGINAVRKLSNVLSILFVNLIYK